ncbi:hypothetical protein [Cellvibrio zantedeschiae]|uniref:hypothetical protein n=1 Tax=Cellvibrio zantedeschiae TaxID=1237077 RepID=UPI0016776C78|nr:hypothetical protein [Cellvibrio zantedeschiae]
MPSTENSNKSLKIRARKNSYFVEGTKVVLKMVHWHHYGAFCAFVVHLGFCCVVKKRSFWFRE